jgi:hypothetical protein
MADTVLQSLIARCAGKHYNRQLDERTQPAACAYGMGMLQEVAQYQHATEVAQTEQERNIGVSPLNLEPVSPFNRLIFIGCLQNRCRRPTLRSHPQDISRQVHY